MLTKQKLAAVVVSVPSKQAFIESQSSLAALGAISIDTISICYTCREIMWRFQIKQGPVHLRGMNIIFLISAAKRIDTVFVGAG
jgi:hypothetical protein